MNGGPESASAGTRAAARADRRAAGRRDRAGRFALVACVALAAAGVVVASVAVLADGLADASTADGPDDAAAGPVPVAPDGEPASAPSPAPSIDDTPRGIVLLTDPSWVARVSEEAGIPARALSAYAGADLYAREHDGCSVGWNTLAAVGLVESEHGTLQGGRVEADGVARPGIVGIPLDGTSTASIPDTDAGSLDGDAVWDRAVGPMQFIPETWAQWGADGDEDGVADIHDIDDAALTAARYLCQAHGTLEGSSAWIGAIRSYNDDPAYQRRVAEAAAHYAGFTAG
ncbi:lytic murein transglycosylase [Microbacterium betulae]|uniref:Lytic murein transglycosylase n=1 Tax=Microbacterium betulae TaxID=2981139 RepID=A0AA97FFY2_9MICO|nr:lytic murein transglycosylase [Microbacterium sp. AB]WOF22821.1 lytic murein transglycosylase [Microbacterium sp. AB]